MKVKVEVELKPFSIPEKVTEVGGCKVNGQGARMYLLEDLDPETLDKMCHEFRLGIFEAAGKRPPSEIISIKKP